MRSRGLVRDGLSPITSTSGVSFSSSSSSLPLSSRNPLSCLIRMAFRRLPTRLLVFLKTFFSTGEPAMLRRNDATSRNFKGEPARSTNSCRAVLSARRNARRTSGEAESARAAEHAAANLSLPMEFELQTFKSSLSAARSVETMDQLSQKSTKPLIEEKSAPSTPTADIRYWSRFGSLIVRCASRCNPRRQTTERLWKLDSGGSFGFGQLLKLKMQRWKKHAKTCMGR